MGPPKEEQPSFKKAEPTSVSASRECLVSTMRGPICHESDRLEVSFNVERTEKLKLKKSVGSDDFGGQLMWTPKIGQELREVLRASPVSNGHLKRQR
jgi:hypothetical protein